MKFKRNRLISPVGSWRWFLVLAEIDMTKVKWLGILAAGVVGLFVLAAYLPAEDKPDAPIDWEKARALHQREVRGENLSADEKTYLERAKAERQKNAGQARPAPNQPNQPRGGFAAPGEPKASTGFVPLSDPSDAKYKEQTLGLYGNGKSEPPAEHLAKAMAAARQIAPLNAEGKPDPAGKIVMMSIGMSNTTQEFSKFVEIANKDAAKNPNLVIVDGAQGGMDAADWADPQRGQQVWLAAQRRAEALKVNPLQVQVVWVKQALKGPQRFGDFPEHAKVLEKHMETIVMLAKHNYPNLKLIYLSSRTYAGWAMSGLNPEPYSYESGFSVRWLIDAQIKGEEKALTYDAAPVLLWGPYLWTDGTKGRALDKLVWNKDDTRQDGTHPSETGREKVAEQLLAFFKGDGTAKGWFGK